MGDSDRKARSPSSESGTPDWLKERRKKAARGELREDGWKFVETRGFHLCLVVFLTHFQTRDRK